MAARSMAVGAWCCVTACFGLSSCADSDGSSTDGQSTGGAGGESASGGSGGTAGRDAGGGPTGGASGSTGGSAGSGGAAPGLDAATAADAGWDAGRDAGRDAGDAVPTGQPHVFVGSTDGTVRAYALDVATGTLTAAGSFAGGSLDFLAVAPDRRTLFVASGGELRVITYDPDADSFAPGSMVATPGGTHVTVDPTGGFVFTADYGGDKLAMHTYSPSAGLGPAMEFSPGDKAHQVRVSKSGDQVYVPCLGSDHVARYALDAGTGQLSFVDNAALPSGAGPRHMDFHPTAAVVYVLSELSSEVHLFDRDTSTGALSARPGDKIATHADGQGHQSSDVKVTPDGKHLYAINRQPDQLVRFAIAADQTLTRLGFDALSADVRSMGMDPAGKYLVVGSADGNLRVLRIDAADGSLAETDSLTGLGTIHAAEISYIP